MKPSSHTRNFLLILAIFFLGACLSCSALGDAVGLAISSRSFEMGFLPIPSQPLTTEAWLKTWKILGKSADFVLEQGGMEEKEWKLFSKNVNQKKTKSIESADFVYGMAKREGLKVIRVIDVMRPQSEDIANLPQSLGKNFGDEKVRRAFKNFAQRHAQYEPTYLGLFAEVNGYIKKHPADAGNVISLVKETYDLVKKVSPNTKITATFQYEGIVGLIDGTAQWEILKMFTDIVDVVAITTYPSAWFANPAEIPDDYYLQLTLHTNKPIIVAESGWPSAGEKRFHGSDENQQAFLKRFLTLTENINLELWIWWFLHDWKGEGYADFFKSMGLMTSDGKAKISWDIWQAIHDLPKR